MTYRLSIAVSIDPSGAKTGGAEARNEVRAIGTEAERARPKIDLVGEALHKVDQRVPGRNVQESVAGIGDAARTAATDVMGLAAASGRLTTSSNDVAAAMQRERQAAIDSTAALKSRNAELKAGAANQNHSSGYTSNIAAQFQDIGVTAAMGMSPIQIALQQGTQLSSVFTELQRTGTGVGAALTGAFTSLFSATSLVTIGLVAGTAALIQYFTAADDGSEGMSADLAKQADLIGNLAKKWGDAIPALKEYADELARTKELSDLSAGVELIKKESLKDVVTSISDVRGAFGALVVDLQQFGEEPDVVLNLQSAFKAFAAAAGDGKLKLDEVAGVQDALAAVVVGKSLPALSDFTSSFETLSAAALKAAGSVRSVNEQAAAAAALTSKYPSQGTYEDILRSPEFTPGGSATILPEIGPTPLRRPLDLNSDPDPQDNRIGNSDGRLVDVPTPTRRPNFFEMDDELGRQRRSEAEAAEKTAKRALEAQANEIEKMQAELSLVGASTSERAKLLSALQAEQRIRQMGLATGSQEAALFRQNAAALTDYAETLRRQTDAWKEVQSAGENALDGVLDKLTNGDFKGALNGLLKDLSDFAMKSMVLNPLKNALFGSNLPTFGDFLGRLASGQKSQAAGIPGAANDNSAGAFSGLGKLIPVTSAPLGASDDVTASALSFIGNYKAGVDAKLTDILNTAAQRFSGFKVDAISGFRAGDPRFHGQGLATDVQLTDLASGKMLGNYQDAGSFRAYEQFAQTARSVQMERYPELADRFRWGGYFGGDKGKYGAVDTMHFDLGGDRVGMGGGTWESGLTSAQRALWPGADSKGMGTAVDAVNKLATASGAATVDLGKVATSAGAATSSIGTLGSGLNTAGQGLGQFGQGLSGFGQQLGGSGGQSSGGGLFSWLGSLFGGGTSPTSSSWTPNTTFGDFLGLSGGGYTGPGGIHEPKGIVHAGEIVWSQSDIARAGGVALVEGMRRGWQGYAKGGMVGTPGPVYPRLPSAANDAGGLRSERSAPQINVYVDNPRGDRDIEEAVDRGVKRGLRQYDQVLPDRLDQIKSRRLVRER